MVDEGIPIIFLKSFWIIFLWYQQYFVWSLTLFRRLSKIDFREALRRALSPSSTKVMTSSTWSWILLFHFLLRFGGGDAFCTDTFLPTDDVTHRNPYTEQFLLKNILTQRGLCPIKLLYTDAFTHRGFYAKKEVFTYRCFVQKCFCAHKQTHIAFLHTEPFPQRNLCTEQFLHMFFLHIKHLTRRNLYTQTAHRRFYRPIFLPAETLSRAVFT